MTDQTKKSLDYIANELRKDDLNNPRSAYDSDTAYWKDKTSLVLSILGNSEAERNQRVVGILREIREFVTTIEQRTRIIKREDNRGEHWEHPELLDVEKANWASNEILIRLDELGS